MGAVQAEEERSLKRLERTETNAPEIDFVRDKDFYLDDGNIILVAEDTAFKIHKSVLSRHSEVFRDMFLLANGSSESHENCQILRLSDSKQDMVCLLRALYDNIVLSPHELIELSHLLRISNKYGIHRLFKRTLETIEKAIPITFEDYKAIQYVKYGHNELTVGAAAIMIGVDIFLPTLYHKFSIILDPSELEILPASSIAKILTGIKPAINCLLNVFKIVKAKQSALDTCSSSTCRGAWEDVSCMLEFYVTSPVRLYNPINALASLCKPEDYDECSSCKTARINLLDTEAKKFWDQLPQIYKVASSWDELRERYDKLKEPDNENSQQ